MSGRARLPSGESRKASQRRTRRTAPAPTVIEPNWRPGDKVHWRDYTRAFLDEYTKNVGKDRNDEEGNAEEEKPGSFTRAASIVSFPAAKFTDYAACDLALSGPAQVWAAEIKGLLDGKMRSHDIAGVSTICSRSACAKTENPGLSQTLA